MVPLRLEQQRAAPPARALASEQVAFLNHLRFVAMACRVRRHTTLFEACALLHAGRSASQMAYAEALMRCLNEAFGKAARLHAPGTSERSFDENWLLQIALACARQDDTSLRFLLESRVRHENRRLLKFLIARVSESFSLT